MASMVGQALAHHEEEDVAVVVEGTEVEETVQEVDRGSPLVTSVVGGVNWAIGPKKELANLVPKEEEASLLPESSSKPLHSIRRVHRKIPISGH
jgi:hypothetical protein